MQADPLQQLRDIHLPAEPSWWPPAPGWWVLALILICGLVWVGFWLARRYQRRRPFARARALLDEYYLQYRRDRLGPLEFAHASNALLKRLIVHVGHDDAARPASGDAWLALLDNYDASNAFSAGPGKALGDQRFRANSTIDGAVDVDALHALLSQFILKVRA